MARRLLVAVLGLGITLPISAQENRPAVRIAGVRAADDAITPVRAQMPDTAPQAMPASNTLPNSRPFVTAPNVVETRGTVSPGAIPPPQIPGGYAVYPAGVTAQPYAGTVITGGPVGGVTMGPAVPMVAQPVMMPADGGLLPGVNCDAPLFGVPGGNPNSVSNKVWFTGEYLSWWTQGSELPVLVTTGPAASNGILGQPGTTVLFGGGQGNQVRGNGGRFSSGYWFGCNQCWGIDSSFFFIDPKTDTFAANSAQFPLIARPFINLNQNIPFAQLTAYPGVATGAISVSEHRDFWGIDFNLRKRWSHRPYFRLDALAGFRYVNFDETMTISESFQRTPNSPPSIGVPNAVSGTVVDTFSTTNNFYGGQLGLQSEWRRGAWYLQGTAKVALGSMHETVTINGSQSLLLTNGSTSTAAGGLYALPGANIGTYSQEKFAVVPEMGINLGYHITPHWRIFVGYNFLYLSNVLRPANQIDTGLDVTRIPNFPVTGVTPLGTVRPTVPLKETSVYTQGISFGTSFTW